MAGPAAGIMSRLTGQDGEQTRVVGGPRSKPLDSVRRDRGDAAIR
jgi:hypothetical protein